MEIDNTALKQIDNREPMAEPEVTRRRKRKRSIIIFVVVIPKVTAVFEDMKQSLPFPLRRWEMVQDATPIIGENDTCLSLSLFGARKSVL